MNTHSLQLLFDYSDWADERILGAAGRLTAAQYVATFPGVSHGSLRATLVHMLSAATIWRLRCLEGVSPGGMLREADVSTFADLRARWAEEAQAMRDGLARLDDAALAATVEYRTTNGTPMQGVLWQLLVHLLNHGTQHRAEAAVALTALGQSPGDVDLILFLRRDQGANARRPRLGETG